MKYLRNCLFLLILCLLPIAFAGCNNDLQENKFSLTNGILTLYGNGTLTNFWGNNVYNEVEEIKFDKGSSFNGIAESTFAGYNRLKKITIPSSIRKIGKDCFTGTSLNNVNYLGDTTSWSNIEFENEYSNPAAISQNVYFNGNSYEDITIYNDYEIKQFSFYNFKKLKKVNLSSGYMSEIGKSAFSNCSNIETINIKNVNQVGENAFYGCTKIKKVFYGGTINYWAQTNFQNEYSNPIYNENTELYINNQLLTNAIIDNANIVKQYAFYGYSFLTNLSISDRSYGVGAYSFYHCTNLAEVNIGNNVRSIATSAFEGCSNAVISIESENITLFGNRCFCYCSKLITPYMGKAEAIGWYAFKNCLQLVDIKLSAKTTITEGAFSGCYNIESLEMAINSTYGLGKIFGKDSSSGCYNASGKYQVPNKLKTIKVINSQTIPAYAIAGCSHVENIILSDTITSIESYAIYECGIQSIELPKSLQKVGEKCLTTTIIDGINIYYSGNLKDWLNIKRTSDDMEINNLYINKNELLTNVCLDDIQTLPWCAFSSVKSITNVTLPSSLTTILNSAFNGCENLISIDFMACDNLSQLGNNMFNGCKKIEIIDLSNTKITALYQNTFCGCSSLTQVLLPDTITEIERRAFYICNKLEKIGFNNGCSITKLENGAFSSCSKLTSIYIKDFISIVPSYPYTPISNCGENFKIYYDGTNSVGEGYLQIRDITLKKGYTYQQYLEEIEGF